eukprot:TRINITY_DN2788_c0_g1_i2.p1 TRINITY_DN2788_c0_g1~~TRINITY_DN2788_c0_g1_i2.p1  ORF type:complete len:239 (-),score=-0.22 TRINITY_DN2788_c0_g1_i2:216-932(-)
MSSFFNCDYIIKMQTLGQSGVGKTSLINRYVNDEFPQPLTSTIGIDFRIKSMVRDEVVVRVQLWDLSGSERFRPIAYSLRYFHGFLLVFDVCDRFSFERLDHYVKCLKDLKQKHESDLRISNKEHTWFLIGNKIDDVERRVISREEAQKKAISLGFPYYETSAKEGTGVFEVIDEFIRITQKRLRQNPEENRPPRKQPSLLQKFLVCPLSSRFLFFICGSIIVVLWSWRGLFVQQKPR